MEKNQALDEAVITIKNNFIRNLKEYLDKNNPAHYFMVARFFYETEDFIKTLEDLKDKEG